MSKVGTAILEIKPVLNTEALDAVVATIERRVASAMSGEAEWSTDDLHRLAACVDNDVRCYHDTMSRPNDNATEDYLAKLGQRILDQVAACRS